MIKYTMVSHRVSSFSWQEVTPTKVEVAGAPLSDDLWRREDRLGAGRKQVVNSSQLLDL
jgi:hypothetical protein